jgi:hypothetical protein
MTDRELIERLLFLAQTAVDQALDLNYDDPEDYFIYRELRELKAAALAQPEPQGPTVMQILALSDEIEAEELGTIDLVRAALARWGRPAIEPDPQGPMESDLSELFYRHVGEGSEVGFENAIAEALARWGRPAIEPVPVSEHLPGPEDCDAEGQCWWWDEDDDMWRLSRHRPWLLCWTHWLPHWALPVPGVEGADA